MNNIIAFNSLVYAFLAILTLIYGILIVFTGKFFKRDTRYVPLNRIVKQSMLTSFLLILGVWLLSHFYSALSNSHISLEKLGDDSFIIAIFLTSSILVSIFILSMFLAVLKTIKMLFVYINLKKDNIPNNLRHALYKKNFKTVINNYKLLKMSDEKVSLSDKEILQLSAVLSNAGMNEDVQKILKIKLFKQNTFCDDMFSVFPNQANYSVQCSSEYISYNDQLKTALQKHAKVFRYIYVPIIIISIFQIYFPILNLIINTSLTTRERTIILVISIIINTMLIIKYKTLKRIHKKYLNIANVKIKASTTDKAIFTAQCILAVTTIAGLLIS
ncbi:TPA: hypothetical protein O5E40_002725 [Staphylococcus aureus]|nr:hypothetical protein [Staphylococcus aureus]HDA4503952.1 hypothetical protein [Staphylococcus aureus]